jgi:regulator of nucleoside diphosphate kinase
MKKRNIIITTPDHARLSELISFGNQSERERGDVRALEEELRQAAIVAPDAVPPDVITMNSRAELLDLDTGERMDFTVVFPGEANLDEGKISVLAPVGTGMLGYRVGDCFEWRVPHGRRRLKVIAVTYQPEAARAQSTRSSAPRTNGFSIHRGTRSSLSSESRRMLSKLRERARTLVHQ